jgi:ABC-type multidrug transport system fused ATPase/permease subunit
MLMPLVFVFSMMFYDLNEAQSFTIEEVYVMMSLIGLIYRPLKNLRKFSITFSEGLYSLKRFALYLDLPEERQTVALKNEVSAVPRLNIQEGTFALSIFDKTGKGCNFPQEISMHFGERLVFLAKTQKEASIFLKSLIGEIETVFGQITLEGSLAYLPRRNCFSG